MSGYAVVFIIIVTIIFILLSLSPFLSGSKDEEPIDLSQKSKPKNSAQFAVHHRR